MMARRQLLGAGASLLLASRARAQSGLWPEWLGSYTGAVRFYRSIPLEDIYPPPEHPHVDLDDLAPFAVYFTIRAEDGGAVVWLRIDGGPMQTTYQGETLRFGPLIDGFAALIAAQAQPAPRSASLTVRPDSLGTEALFSHRRRQLLAPPLQRPLHAGRRRRDRLGVRRRRHARPHLARLGGAQRLASADRGAPGSASPWPDAMTKSVLD